MKKIGEYKYVTQTVITPYDIYGSNFSFSHVSSILRDWDIIDFRIPLVGENIIAGNCMLILDVNFQLDQPRFILKRKRVTLLYVNTYNNKGKTFKVFNDENIDTGDIIMITIQNDGRSNISVISGNYSGNYYGSRLQEYTVEPVKIEIIVKE